MESGQSWSYGWLYDGPCGWPYRVPPPTATSPPYIGIREAIQLSTYPFGQGNTLRVSQPPSTPSARMAGATTTAVRCIARAGAQPAASVRARQLVVPLLPPWPVFAPGTPYVPPEACNKLPLSSPSLQAVVGDRKRAGSLAGVLGGLTVPKLGVSRSLDSERLRTHDDQIMGGNRRRLQKGKRSVPGYFGNPETALGGKRARDEPSTHEGWTPPGGITLSQTDGYGGERDANIYSKKRRVAKTTVITSKKDIAMTPEFTDVNASSEGSSTAITSPALLERSIPSTMLPPTIIPAATVGEGMISSLENMVSRGGAEGHYEGGGSTVESMMLSSTGIEVLPSIQNIQCEL